MCTCISMSVVEEFLFPGVPIRVLGLKGHPKFKFASGCLWEITPGRFINCGRLRGT